jgi:hypothetical protein
MSVLLCMYSPWIFSTPTPMPSRDIRTWWCWPPRLLCDFLRERLERENYIFIWKILGGKFHHLPTLGLPEEVLQLGQFWLNFFLRCEGEVINWNTLDNWVVPRPSASASLTGRRQKSPGNPVWFWRLKLHIAMHFLLRFLPSFFLSRPATKFFLCI